MIDGGLYHEFRKHLPEFHWQRIETGIISGGVPDVNYCLGGIEGWIEFKQTPAWRVSFRSEQVSWLIKRTMMGGRVFIAIRRKHPDMKRTFAVDELWLFNAKDVIYLRDQGLRGPEAPIPLLVTSEGSAKWDWRLVKKIITA